MEMSEEEDMSLIGIGSGFLLSKQATQVVQINKSKHVRTSNN